MDAATVRHVARLARLRLGEEEIAAQAEHFDRLLALVSVIRQAGIEDVAPMHHPLDLEQPLRPDRSEPPPARAALLALAPDADDEHFLVPRVIE